jgi:hypothetical protein
MVDFGQPLCLWTVLSLVPGPDVDRCCSLVTLGNLFFHYSLSTKAERAFTEGIGQVMTEIIADGAERLAGQYVKAIRKPIHVMRYQAAASRTANQSLQRA